MSDDDIVRHPNGEAFNPRAFRRSLRRAGLTATQYRVAVELCEYATQDKSVVWPSVAVLAEDCELGRSTVIRVLGQLESKGFIVCDGGRDNAMTSKPVWPRIKCPHCRATVAVTPRGRISTHGPLGGCRECEYVGHREDEGYSSPVWPPRWCCASRWPAEVPS